MENNFEKTLEQQRKISDLIEKLHAWTQKDKGNNEILNQFIDHLKKEHGEDCDNYDLYHILVHGGNISGHAKFDFPEEDSIEKFIEDNSSELQKEQE